MATNQPAPSETLKAKQEDRIVVVSDEKDCTPELLDRIKAEALAATSRCNSHREIAEELKKKFDEIDGPTWNCIVGYNFAASVKHISSRFVYFYIDQLGFLLFKSQ